MKKIKIVTILLAVMLLAACGEEETDNSRERVREEKTAE